MKQFSLSTAALLITLLLVIGVGFMNPAPALASVPMAGGQMDQDAAPPTPAPQTNQAANTRGASPIVGIIILVMPAIFMLWKSRGKKQPEIKGACCLPVIDENRRPFQILDDEKVPGSSAGETSPR